MGKPVLQLAAFGIVGVILWKLLAGVLLGVLFTVFRIAFFVALVWFAVWVFRRWSDKKKDDKPAESTP
jgi:predicted membrane channel-forming protein YqfA (hemolysin III family)